jgi:hypothetical protein
MSNAVERFSELKNIIVDVKVSAIAGKAEFVGNASVSLFNPEKMIQSGGPVTVKGVNTCAVATTYEGAYEAVLEKAAQLLGI